MAVVFRWYLALLSSFCFFSHPIVRCILLVATVLSLGYGVFLIVGYRWYIGIFCIVYVGGVYVLLVFVFLSCSNSGVIGGFGAFVWVIGVFLLSLVVLVYGVRRDSYSDCSVQLMGYGYRWGYLFLCVRMMLSLVEVRIICSKKNSFYR